MSAGGQMLWLAAGAWLLAGLAAAMGCEPQGAAPPPPAHARTVEAEASAGDAAPPERSPGEASPGAPLERSAAPASRCASTASSEPRAASPAEGLTSADFTEHVRRLRPRVPEGFTVVVQPPFVVIGDESPRKVRVRAEGTVGWAVARLKEAYFAKDPPHIIDIWLFKNRESYRKHAKALFGAEPTTPFGYYSPSHRALVMNIATGGGTLVHEIVHPFMRANFPACPTWFDEGLASLYEQSSQRKGRIVGLTNWRLAGLQQAVRAGRLPTFKALTATTDHQFRAMDSGRNYAQARYLCYYLQERGLLGKFYHAFRAAHREDPTGYETLVRVLGQEDMAAFQERWEAWVLGLRFP